MIGTLVDARFRLQQEVARGPNTTLFRVTDARDGTPAALKLLHTVTTQDALHIARFAREAHIAATFEHPAHVPVRAVGLLGGEVPYYVADWIEGQPLSALVSPGAPLPVPQASAYADGLLAYLGALHRRGVAHRDIHPGNVMVDASGRLRVLDLGIASFLEAAEWVSEEKGWTPAGRVMGTPEYCPPERLSGADRYSEYGDIYAAAALIYWMITGALPWVSPADRSVIVPMRAFIPAAPVELEAVLVRALAPNVGERFPSAESLREALARARGDGGAKPSRGDSAR